MLEQVSVIVERGVIKTVTRQPQAISEHSLVIDGRNKWLMPGIVEFHSHDTSQADLRRAFSLGITSIHVITSQHVYGSRNNEHTETTLPLPRIILTTGLFGKFIQHILPGMFHTQHPVSAAEVSGMLQDMVDAGVAGIKIWQDDNELWGGQAMRELLLSEAVVRRIVTTSHRQSLRVYAHAWQHRHARALVHAGVDALLHPIADEIVGEDLWRELRVRQTPWTTTMAVLVSLADPVGYAARILSDPNLSAALTAAEKRTYMAQRASTETNAAAHLPALASRYQEYLDNIGLNTRRAVAEGLVLTLGSDAVSGLGTHLEAELLSEIGLSNMDIIIAATFGGAVALGLADSIGSIELGKQADFLILNKNPLLDIRNMRAIEWVSAQGRLYRPSDVASAQDQKL